MPSDPYDLTTDAASTTASSSTQAPCPVCNTLVPAVQLVQHANRCLDVISGNIQIPSPPSSPPSTPASPSPNPKPHKKTTKPERTAPDERDTPVAEWLEPLGLAKYASNVLQAGFRTLNDFGKTPPTDAILREKCQITAMGARRKLLSEIAALPKATPPLLIRQKQDSKNVTHPKTAQSEGNSKRKTWAIFEPGYCAASPTKQPDPKRARAEGNSLWKGPRTHRMSQRVAGTSFTVDSFYAAKTDPGCTNFFLTHFHADHYGGLTKKILPDGARVLCSSITAKLVKDLLRIPDSFMRILPIGKKIDIPDGKLPGSGASVWLFDANHCPGAVVLLFYVWMTKRYVLHSGDCRFDPRVFKQHDKLAQVIQAGQLDYLYLDTTYCNPKYVFPHQDTILAQVVDAARNEDRRTRGRCLFFFGTYSIGKEKVFLAVAEALDLKIYSGKRKIGILKSLQMGRRIDDRLVETAGEARVQVVSMRALSAEGLREYAKRNKLNADFIGRGLAVLFRPTGWSFQSDKKTPCGASRSSDQAMFYNVAYSEHSSFDELRAFVDWAKPAKVIPTVNARSKADADRLRETLGHTDRSLRSVN